MHILAITKTELWTSWIQVGLAIFTLLLAVGGLIYGSWRRREDIKEADDQRRRDLADKVIAWSVSEGTEAGVGTVGGEHGVVLDNDSGVAALNVCLKTRAEKVDPPDSTTVVTVPSGVPGTRFALVPPGTYYTRYEPGSDGEPWTSLLPVDTSSGYFSTTIQDDDAQSTTVPLLPRSLSPSPSRVVLLRYEIADRTWWRDASMALHGPESAGTAAGPTEEAWESEFEKAGKRVRTVAQGKRDPSVQAATRALFTELTQVSPGPNGACEAKLRTDYGLTAHVRLPRSQQTVLIDLLEPDGKPIDVTYRLQGRGTGKPTVGSMFFHHPAGVGPADGIRIKSASANALSRSPDDLRTPDQVAAYADQLVRSVIEHHRARGV